MCYVMRPLQMVSDVIAVQKYRLQTVELNPEEC